MIVKTISLFLILFFSCGILFAKTSPLSIKPLKHFTPGNYILKDGAPEKCSEGSFYLQDNNKVIVLGAYHLFDTTPQKRNLQGDFPGDTHCQYKSEDTVNIKSLETELVFTENRFCGDQFKHKTVKQAFVEKDKVTLLFNQTGDAAKSYSCYWELQKK